MQTVGQKADDAQRYRTILESAGIKRGQIRPVNPTLCAFAFLGMVLWIYKWFRPNRALLPNEIAEGMVDLFFGGLQPSRS